MPMKHSIVAATVMLTTNASDERGIGLCINSRYCCNRCYQCKIEQFKVKQCVAKLRFNRQRYTINLERTLKPNNVLVQFNG
jgi:hypothetical protein